MASRDKKDLRLELSMAYDMGCARYKELYPNDPQPFLTCTFRSNEEQNQLFTKVPRVTNAKAGQSPHNFNPSFAFDIAFITVEKKISWNEKYFKLFANCIKEVSSVVSWGGDWKGFRDTPHFELLNWKNLK